MAFFLCLFLISLFFLPIGSFAAVFNVKSSAELQDALNEAAANGEDDIINITAGTYNTGALSFAYRPAENFALTIVGAGAEITLLDGGNRTRVLKINTSRLVDDSNADITITGLTIKNGNNTLVEHEKSFSPYKPNSTGMTHGHTVRINNLGFRGPDYPIRKPKNGFRILVLGDSFTFGQGIGESEVYTALLERELTGRFPEKKIEMINLGVMGYSAVDEMRLLHRAGPLLNPDLILIGFCGNDVREGNQVTERERNRLAFPLPNRIKFFLQSHFKLFGWLAEKYNQLLMNVGVRPDVFSSLDSAYDTSSDEWKRFVTAYEIILEWTQRQSIPPPVVGLLLSTPNYDPNKNDFIDMTPEIRVYLRHMRQVERTLNNMGIHTVDYLPLFQRHNKQALYVSKWEGHPNALANQLYAEGFLRLILDLNLIQ